MWQETTEQIPKFKHKGYPKVAWTTGEQTAIHEMEFLLAIRPKMYSVKRSTLKDKDINDVI